MTKYIVLTLLFLLKIGFVFGQNTDSLFHVISKKHENVPFYTIIKDTIYSKNKKSMYSYEFVQRKHKDKVFVFVVFSENMNMKYYRYYASKKQNDKQFTIIDKDEKELYSYWKNIELLDLNNDNIQEIAIYYEIGYPCNHKEIYNFSTDSLAPVVLKAPYDIGILVCIDTTKNLYFTINRNNLDGLWNSELFIIPKNFSKEKIIGTAIWDGIKYKKKINTSAYYIKPVFNISSKQNTYFDSNSRLIIEQFHPNVNHWNSKENIEFMKNAYLKMIEEFNIEY
ncbi:hypothetical protein ACE193_03185 [Bernardetia sp. OM2101]|uniref:hypothetical protein n=1 Tax=Bernardetia sp. OM2101 TaxID=3344876 RepID=UPI0035D0B4AB